MLNCLKYFFSYEKRLTHAVVVFFCFINQPQNDVRDFFLGVYGIVLEQLKKNNDTSHFGTSSSKNKVDDEVIFKF